MPPPHLVLVDGGGLFSQAAWFPCGKGEPVALRDMSVCLHDSFSQRPLLEGSACASLPKPLPFSRILVWASEPPPSLSYIGLDWLGGGLGI